MRIRMFGASLLLICGISLSATANELQGIYKQLGDLQPAAKNEFMQYLIGEGNTKSAFLIKDKAGKSYALKVCQVAEGCLNQLRTDTEDNFILKRDFGDLYVDYYPENYEDIESAPKFPCALNRDEVNCGYVLERFVSNKFVDLREDMDDVIRGNYCIWPADQHEIEFTYALTDKIREVAREHRYPRSLLAASSFARIANKLKTVNYILEDLQGGFDQATGQFTMYDTGVDREPDLRREFNCQINWICGLSKVVGYIDDPQLDCRFIREEG